MSLLVVLPLGAGAPLAAVASTPGRVEQVTVSSGEHGPEIQIRTSRPLRYRSQVIVGTPQRLVLDFEEARFAWRDSPLRPESGPVAEIRGSQFRAGVARIVIALEQALPHIIDGTPDGLRVVIRLPETGAPSAAPHGRVAPPTSAPAPTRETTTRPILHGIVLRGEDSIAYMEDPRTRRVTGFKLGDAVGDGVLEVIEERQVVVRMPSGLVEIRVDEPKAGAAAPVIQVTPGAARR